jgi:hypothetical protein
MRRRLREEHGLEDGDELLQTHDESSLMRDMGIMNLPQSIGDAPGWVRYNDNFVKP